MIWLFLRGGYKALFLPNSEQGLTLGVGIKYELDFRFEIYI